MYILAGVLLAGSILLGPSEVWASEEEISYDQVASEGEQTARQEVGIEGMYPIYGTDVADGVYEIQVESSSSMFRVERAELTVHGGRDERGSDFRGDRVSEALPWYRDRSSRESHGRLYRL